MQLNDLHHWAPKQPASVSGQGWLRITLWNDIKLVKHFSAYRLGQGVPYFTPASNFSLLLSSFLQFSWGKCAMQPLQGRLDPNEKVGDFSVILHVTAVQHLCPESRSITLLFSCHCFFVCFNKYAQFLLLFLSPCFLLLQISLAERSQIMPQANCFHCHTHEEVRYFWGPLLANRDKCKTTHEETTKTKNTS